VEFPLTRTEDGWYAVDINLAGNSSSVIVDTASPWVWAYGAPQDGEVAPKFEIHYGSASLSGVALEETVSFGSAPPPPAGSSSSNASEANKCRAGRATSGDGFWTRQRGVGGVLGLSCGGADSGSPMLDGSADGALEPALGCVSRAVGQSSSFSLQLGDSGGTLSFGAAPVHLLRGLVEMPASTLCGLWRAPLRVSVQGHHGEQSAQAEAVFDSAAKGIVGPTMEVARLGRALGATAEVVGAGHLVHRIPCEKASAMPSVIFTFAGTDREAKVEFAGADLVVPDTNSTTGGCRLILGAQEDSQQWLLGIPFFRKIRGAVFDVDPPTVSIAP